jgi:hypothetical protein
MPPSRRAPPTRRDTVSAGKWRTVGAALEDWPRTIRLCLIVMSMNAPVGFILWLILH